MCDLKHFNSKTILDSNNYFLTLGEKYTNEPFETFWLLLFFFKVQMDP